MLRGVEVSQESRESYLKTPSCMRASGHGQEASESDTQGVCNLHCRLAGFVSVTSFGHVEADVDVRGIDQYYFPLDPDLPMDVGADCNLLPKGIRALRRLACFSSFVVLPAFLLCLSREPLSLCTNAFAERILRTCKQRAHLMDKLQKCG